LIGGGCGKLEISKYCYNILTIFPLTVTIHYIPAKSLGVLSIIVGAGEEGKIT